MRIGIVKPDFGVVGGFEVLTARLERELVARGHEVEWRIVSVPGLPDDPFALRVPKSLRARAWEAFRYFALVEAFRDVDTSGLDVVLSTQPPSFVTPHPHHLALFSHHQRIFYDLSDAYVASGFADPSDHQLAEQAVRRVDAHYMPRVDYWLATSEVVQDRLHRYNGLVGCVGVLHAGSTVAEQQLALPMSDVFDAPICVSRHEWPKRTELFVHALKHLPGTRGISVGSGGRLEFVRALDARLSAPGIDLAGVDNRDLWLNRGVTTARPTRVVDSNVRFTGAVDDRELARLYRSALCVVAPAYLEDYGLTAIEAMAFGKPLIVCSDGGGLTAFVDHGVNGFVVEPSGPAIAEAVARLVEDRDLARTMGIAGRERAREYSWARAMNELDDGLSRVIG